MRRCLFELYTLLTPVKSISVFLGGLTLSIGRIGTGRKASCGALEGMVEMFVLVRWFTSAHIYFRNSTYFLQNKTVLCLNYLDRLKFRNHVPPPCLNFRLFRK